MQSQNFTLLMVIPDIIPHHPLGSVSERGGFLMPLVKTTVMTLSFWTDRSGQTVQTQIRLLLEEPSDQGLHCLLFHLHLFEEKP